MFRVKTAGLIVAVYCYWCDKPFLPSFSLSLSLPPSPSPSLPPPHPNFPQGRGPKKAGKRSSNKKGSKKAGSTRNKSSKKGSLLIGGDDLSQKLYQTMEKHREVREKREEAKEQHNYVPLVSY